MSFFGRLLNPKTPENHELVARTKASLKAKKEQN